MIQAARIILSKPISKLIGRKLLCMQMVTQGVHLRVLSVHILAANL